MLKYSHFLLMLFCANCWASADKAALHQANDAPLKIDAQGGVTCDKVKQTCTATNNVVVEKGLFKLHCDNLTAHLRKGKTNKMEMWRVVATGNVRLVGAEKSEKAFARTAEYNLDAAKVSLQGSGADFPVATKDNYIIRAQKIEVLLHRNNDKQSIHKMQAFEQVLLSAPEEIATADFADYNPEENKATIKGNVKIYKKEGKLTGSQAIINLADKTSMISDTPNAQDGPPKRVQALILPKNLTKDEKGGQRKIHEK